MRSIQDYRNIYQEIADNLNLQGASVELLVQLLSQASYISEIESVSYVQEASLEKATLMNSKIQKCMDDMYSVFRGTCPRVILNIIPQKEFMFNPFDEIVSSNNFKVYYLGYYDPDDTIKNEDGTKRISIVDGFKYGQKTIMPTSDNKSYKIIGLIASETSKKTWQLSKNNTYYVENTDSNLSNDLWLKNTTSSSSNHYLDTTRNFADHITNAYVFDLTLPEFGSRLYVADIFRDGSATDVISDTDPNTSFEATYYKYSKLEDYNSSELKKINLKGAILSDFELTWLTERGYQETSSGLILLEAGDRDTVSSVHYKANRERYMNSLLRSNSDIGSILEETYSDVIAESGTSYKFFINDDESSTLTIYYIPKDSNILLTESQKDDFKLKRSSYYVTDTIAITEGTKYNAIINLDLLLYQSTSIDDELKQIIEPYNKKFNINLTEKEKEIESLISKISNVKLPRAFEITYTDSTGKEISDPETTINNNLYNSYFEISYMLNATID